MVKALIFDYNQVIADDFELHSKAYKLVFSRHGVEVHDSDLIELTAKINREKVAILAERYNVKTDPKILAAEKEDAYVELLDGKDFIYPGVEDTIEKLHKKYILGIVTGTTKKQFLISDKLAAQFQVKVLVGDYEKPKPNPEGLLKCIKSLGLESNECAYIGDAVTDIEAARNAGCKIAIGVATGNTSFERLEEAGADFVINSLKELLELNL